jgi:hypothetical protein
MLTQEYFFNSGCRILKVTNSRTISTRFSLIWFGGFRGEYLNVKVYDIRRMDGRQVMAKTIVVYQYGQNNIC